MAAKANDSAAKIDLAAWEWSKACTACHPGGGAMETDRDGHRYDVRAARNDWTAFDGDYYGSDWGASGVVEADCLLCHQDTYRTSRRAPLLAKAWHRAAPAEGAGMGVARDNLTVDYDVAFQLRIGATAPKNCDQCHAAYEENDLLDLFNSPGNIKSDIAKRGRSSNDPHNPDVHEQAGMTCVACHPAGEGTAGARTVTKLEHQFAKGHVMVGSSVQDDLDKALGYLDCRGCHTTGAKGAPAIPSTGFHSNHTDTIACETCHIPKKNFFAAAAFDFSEGAKYPFWRGGSPTNPHGGGFQPSYLWWKESPSATTYRIYPFNGLTAVFWNRNGVARNAFFLKQAAAAVAALPAGTLTNDVPDSANVAEPNKTAEITALAAKLLELNPGTDPVLWIEPDWFQLSHNVAPKAQALGATTGCTECHSTGSAFFNRAVQLMPASWPIDDVPGKVVMEVHVRDRSGTKSTIEGLNPTLPMWRLLGYTPERKAELETLMGQ